MLASLSLRLRVFLFFALLAWGFLDPKMLIVGAILVFPYMLANVIGAKIFRPEAEKTYRFAAYAIIAVSAIRGLPIWG